MIRALRTKRIVSLFLSILVGGSMVLYALLYTPATATPTQTISHTDLAKHTGTNGTACWVAVDGIVYAISGFSEWQMGKHLPANDNNIVCGRDLSAHIGKSPHGKSVLQLLRQVGKLQKGNW
jgi:predicted heme/steroid binding protein